jgi:hypothetical protein
MAPVPISTNDFFLILLISLCFCMCILSLLGNGSIKTLLRQRTRAKIIEPLDAFFYVVRSYERKGGDKFFLELLATFYLCNCYIFKTPLYNKFSKLANHYSDSLKALIKEFINIHPYSNIQWGVIRDGTLNMAANPASREQKQRDNGTFLCTNCTVMSAVKFPTGVARWHPCHQLSTI